jgi:hypothetical protein
MADIAGPLGQVIAIDIQAGMLSVAQERAREAHLFRSHPGKAGLSTIILTGPCLLRYWERFLIGKLRYRKFLEP